MPDNISASSNPQQDVARDPQETPWYGHMTSSLERIANFSERQREKLAPGVLDLTIPTTVPVSNTFSSHVKMRVVGVVISTVVAAATDVSITIGSYSYHFVAAAGSTQPLILFPITILNGTDVSASVAAAPASPIYVYLFYYPE